MKAPSIPFLYTRSSYPALTEEAALSAFNPAYPGAEQVSLIGRWEKSSFYGSNVELQRCIISSGVHPPLSIRSTDFPNENDVILELPFSGSLTLTAENDKLTVMPAQAILTTQHEWVMESTDYAGIVIRIPKNDLISRISFIADIEYEFRAIQIIDSCEHLSVGVINSLRSIQSFYNDNMAKSGIYDEMILNAVALLLANSQNNNFPRSIESMKNIVTKARNIIHRDVFENITVAEIAANLNVSERHIQNCFLTITGISPKQYIMTEKLEFASNFIKDNPSISISKIAEDFGFSSPSHFSIAYKNIFGYPPSKLRKY